MSLEVENQRGGLNPFYETSHESQKKLRISYTRGFLLSFSESGVCKKLPRGFDLSLLSEFEDTSQDRYRIPGSLSSQSFRRNEFGSSPPTRGDSSNYSRGIQGRWDSRSSGRSDRDSDLQSELDCGTDSGRRYGDQSRQPWQVPEHDGLLGSGSFPRPSGYASGSSTPKFRANDQIQLNRSNEPYHPPRPYKAVPHSRRDTNDSYNDETFGSSEFTSEDRAEEERKRRDSFESMRKEQQKAFQEKHKSNLEKCKDDFDVTLLKEDLKDDKTNSNRSNISDEPVLQPVLNHDSAKPSLPSSAPASRPLVPPGFTSSMSEKNNGLKSLNNLHSLEVGNELDGGLLHTKGNRESNEALSNKEEKQYLEQKDLRRQWLGSPSVDVSVSNKSEKIPNLSASDVSGKATDVNSPFYKTSKISKLSAAIESSENSEILELDAENMPGNKVVVEPSPAQSASILEKLFGSAPTLNGSGSSNFFELPDTKSNDTCSLRTVQSSKFAQWFFEDEKKPVDDLSAGGPSDLLSLIVGSEKGGSKVFDVKTNDHALSNFSAQSSELSGRRTSSNLMSSNVENNEPQSDSDKSEAVATVLTCEDLEQSIMSEITKNSSNLSAHGQCWSDREGRIDKQKADIDDRASQHLLLLLQKGTGLEDVAPSANLGAWSSDRPENSEVANMGTALLNSGEADAGIVPNSGKLLTLETLFGSAFMKELQSTGAPTSDYRGSVFKVDGSESHGLPSTGEIASSISGQGSGVAALNQRQQKKSDTIGEHLLEFDTQNEVDSSRLLTELGTKPSDFDGSVEIGLPEEDSLITVSEPPNHQNFIAAQGSAKAELLSIPETLDIVGKLAALNSPFQDAGPIVGQDGPPFLRSPYDMREPDVHYHNLHAQPSSPQLHSLQLNHTGLMFHPMDSHPANFNPQMKVMTPEHMIHRDTLPNHQFSAKMLHLPFSHPSTAPAGFDPTAHHPMLRQMHVTSNFSLPHLLRGLPRGAPPLMHPNSQVPGFMQEPNPMQGFHLSQRQANFGGIGVPPPVAEGGGNNHPEALQRLVEMELRSNSKQTHHPFATAGYGPGMHGHELDMGFGYR